MRIIGLILLGSVATSLLVGMAALLYTIALIFGIAP